MCTVTIFPTRRGLVVTMNRDERRDRPEGPVLCEGPVPGVRYAYPVDQHSSGTWFGINNQGLVFALLNRYDDTHWMNAASRGNIIPGLVGVKGEDLDTVMKTRDWSNYNPFDLLVIQTGEIRRFSWNGQFPAAEQVDARVPFLLTSSSVNADRVQQHRSDTFKAFVAVGAQRGVDPHAVLEDLHLASDAQDPTASIFMARADRHTKSVCQAILTQQSVELRYFNQSQLNDRCTAGSRIGYRCKLPYVPA